MATSSLDIANMAVRHLGDPGKMTSITSPASALEVLASTFYATARDMTLEAAPWKFATRKVPLYLTDIEGDGDDEDHFLNGEWAFAYEVPPLCIRILKVLPEAAQKNRPSEDFERLDYAPVPLTALSTDTTAETVTFSRPHNWITGTAVTVAATAGGLTAATTYYVNAISTTAVTFHTTLAAALAGTGDINLTANITAEITPVPVPLIMTNVEDAYAHYITRVVDVTRYSEHFVLTMSYLLASLLANPVVKGKAGVQMAVTLRGAFEAEILKAVAMDARQEQISEQFKTHTPSWMSDR